VLRVWHWDGMYRKIGQCPNYAINEKCCQMAKKYQIVLYFLLPLINVVQSAYMG